MGLTTSLYTGLSGLNANSQLINVAGNNIANVNTTGFKSSRADFETQISQTLSRGSAPTDELGGTNPIQLGMGTRLGSITRNFTDGSIQPTGVNTELALEGNGFFILNFNGNTRYTRAGNFKLDSNFNLVNQDGGLVQGYGIDPNYNLVPGTLGPLTIPLGNLTLAEATQNVRFKGNLNAGGDAAVNRSLINSDPLYSDAAGTIPASAGDALASLFDADGAQLFAAGDVLTFGGATKGGAALPEKTFEIGASNTTGSDDFGATLQDLMDFFSDALGIDTSVAGAGVSVSGGQIAINGNTGSANDLVVDGADIVKNKDTAPTTPLAFTKATTADGESVRTTFVGYDSLGTPMSMDLTLVLENKTDTGTTWRFYAQSEDDTDLSRVIGNGTLTFDTDGKMISSSGTSITMDRSGTGAATPQQITMHFNDAAGGVSALADANSQIGALSQDGTSLGTLEDFAVGTDGVIRGVFSNSEIRNLGQVVLATFANPVGLTDAGGNLYGITQSSGDAVVVAPGSGGAGAVVGGALELSNVDLSQEFINLITASTGFSANSRVLTTSDRLIQELLTTIR